jgi:hypothetical protein
MEPPGAAPAVAKIDGPQIHQAPTLSSHSRSKNGVASLAYAGEREHAIQAAIRRRRPVCPASASGESALILPLSAHAVAK